jgi:DNA-binding response OmpR family regulator
MTCDEHAPDSSVAVTRFLIVEDDSGVGQALTKLARKYGKVVVATTAKRAEGFASDVAAWSGFVIDPGLPDGSGLDVLAFARRVHSETAALVLSGTMNRDIIHRAYELGAEYLVKPVAGALVERFFSNAGRGLAVRVALAIQDTRRRHHLSEAEADVLRPQRLAQIARR